MNQQAGVVIFGEVLVDVFPQQSVLGGAPFNVARHLQAFALQPLLISRLGQDALAERLLAAMRSYGMDIRAIQRDALYPTGQVHVELTDDGHRFDICDEQAYDHIQPAPPTQPWPDRCQLVYFGSLVQRHAHSRKALHSLLANTSGLRFVDINLREPWYTQASIHQSLQFADIAKMNQEELVKVAQLLDLPGKDPQAQGLALRQAYQLQALVITAGEQGAWQVERDGSVVRAPQQLDDLLQSKLVDTVGAGDAFAAMYIAGRLRHWPTAQTLARANAFAAALCTVRGGVPDDDFYLPFVQQWQDDAHGVAD